MTTSDRSAFTTHRALASQSREQLLHLLNESDEVLTISDLADRTGLHPNTVREHLNILIAAELVNSESQTSGGRGEPQPEDRPTAAGAVVRSVRIARPRHRPCPTHVRRKRRIPWNCCAAFWPPRRHRTTSARAHGSTSRTPPGNGFTTMQMKCPPMK